MSRAGLLPRRSFLALGGAALALPVLPRPGLSANPRQRPVHGLSAFGDLKYPENFEHFDYANPDAPAGGTFRFSPPNWGFNQNTLTFNTLNSFVLSGDAPPRMEMCFDALMARAIDEPDAIYGLLAETVTISGDANSFEFRMRPQARFHDGTKLTAEDAAFSYRLFKEKGHPQLLLPLSELDEAIAVDEYLLRLTFSGRQSRRTILTVAGFPIVSKAFFEANPFDSSQLNPPLGSGPYKVGRFDAGRLIEYVRADDYWGRDLPVRRGLNHFDRIRIDFFRDRQAGFEAFKKGNIEYRQEFTSQVWATGYDFPALNQGKVLKREVESEAFPSMQAWAVNQRRERFSDPRIREAIGLCFDFEWTKRNLFYGSYERSQSPFEQSVYRAEATPDAQEMELLERFRGKVPEAVFGEAVTQPVSDGSGRDRDLLRRANRLFTEAGWTRRNGILHNEDGNRFTLEFLVRDAVFTRVLTPFVGNLKAVGVDATIREVDATQYQARQTSFEFDVISMAMSFSATPTHDGLERVFHSRAADLPGSRNLPGTKDPVVDALIEEAGKVEDRESLITVMRALDRVLRARRDWIPNWYSANHRVAHWDIYGYPETKPDYGFPVESLWWYDEEKAAAIGKG